MTQDWYIREALPGDANALKACMESAYSIYLERMEGITLPPMVQDYELEINNYPVWVVQCENRIVGGMIMNFEEKHAFLANIAVQVEYQGLGIGGKLLKLAEEQARRKNYGELRLTTHVLLKENVSLYLYQGWTELKRDGTRVYMGKLL
jgi:GNAT superfamily N-acetyltransferase